MSATILQHSDTKEHQKGGGQNVSYISPPHFHRSLRVWCIPGEYLEIALTRAIPRGVRTYIFHPSKT